MFILKELTWFILGSRNTVFTEEIPGVNRYLVMQVTSKKGISLSSVFRDKNYQIKVEVGDSGEGDPGTYR